jgi:hypothetical protein
MATFRAKCKIQLSDPDAAEEFTGNYDALGEPIMKRRPRIVRADDVFEITDESTIAYLRKIDAICDPSEERVRAPYREAEG